MITVEYRLPLPVSLAEYNRALRYVVARVADSTTGVTRGEGVEILKNEPFGPDNEHGMREGGVYTEKVLRFRSRLPALLRRVMPLSATEIHECSWFSSAKDSRCKTVYRNAFLGDRFFLSIESNHLAGIDTNDNALDLKPEELESRQVMYLDIAGNVPRKLPSEDPSTFVSQKTGVGLLKEGWWKDGIDNANGDSCVIADGKLEGARARNCHSCSSHVGPSASEYWADEVPSLMADNSFAEVGQEGEGTMDGKRDLLILGDSSTGSQEGREVRPRRGDRADGTPGDQTILDASVVPADVKHAMTCYKLVKIAFTGFGLRRFVQRWVTQAVIPNGFLDLHRKLYCWMDDWMDLTLEEIEEIESETAENVRNAFEEQKAGDFSKCADTSLADVNVPHEYEYL